MTTMRQDGYCGTCYTEAKKAGRDVRLTTVYPYPVCGMCEQRIRNGLVHYRPSNGTEFEIFRSRCEDCRHCREDLNGEPRPGTLKPPFANCAWGVLDRVYVQQGEDYDHISTWFDPAELQTTDADGSPSCPAVCLRFTHKDDSDGEFRDPPPPDCEGQLTFSDVLEVTERVVVPVNI